MSQLPPQLVERVLARLVSSAHPSPDLDGLGALYDAWCRRVPFDNVQKRLFIARRGQGPLPGDEPARFFEDWLAHGTGGTCWAANGALCALLQALGFDARRGVGTMLVAPDVPPNHGTVVVRLDGRDWLVDASILMGQPLPVQDGARVEHAAWGVRLSADGDRWVVDWRPLQKLDGLGCRIDHLEATADEFRTRHEATRGWSPFNWEICVRLNVGDRVEGIAYGEQVTIDASGNASERAIDGEERTRVLVDELGFSEEIATQLPADEPTPAPPKPPPS